MAWQNLRAGGSVNVSLYYPKCSVSPFIIYLSFALKSVSDCYMRVLERRKHASSVLCEYSCIPLTEFRALGRPWYLTNPVLRQSGTTAFIHSSFLVIFCLLWFDKNSRLSLYSNSNVEPFLVIFLYLVFFARQWSLEKFAILSLKPRSNARILNTERGLFFFFFFFYLPQN